MRALAGFLAPVVSGGLMVAMAGAMFVAGCSNETKFTRVEPNQGVFTGGEEIELEGNAFPKGGVTVRFGFKEAAPVVTETDKRIKVMSPPGDKNTNVDVTITFDDGRAFVLKNGFHYIDNTQQRATMDKFFDKASGQKK